MDLYLGMNAIAVVSVIVFFLASIAIGSAINDPVYAEKEIEKYEGDPTDPRSKLRGRLLMSLINGGPTGLVVSTSIFNFLFPIVNILGQIPDLDFISLSKHSSLYFISIIAAFITLKVLKRLVAMKSEINMKDNLANDFNERKDIQYYILKQYVIYNLAIIFCWYFRGKETNNIINIVLFVVVLTIDDWNMISKYLEFIPVSKFKKLDILKMLLVAVLIPIIIIGETVYKIGFSILNYYSIVGLLVFFWIWVDLIRLSLKYFKKAESW